MAESEEELKSLLTRVKDRSKKAGLKLNIQKTETTTSLYLTPHIACNYYIVSLIMFPL